jgi:hypothetical protein
MSCWLRAVCIARPVVGLVVPCGSCSVRQLLVLSTALLHSSFVQHSRVATNFMATTRVPLLVRTGTIGVSHQLMTLTRCRLYTLCVQLLQTTTTTAATGAASSEPLQEAVHIT